jgi:hypothetical protein
MTSAHHEALYVAPDVLLQVVVSDGGEARLELVYVRGAGAPPLLLNRMPVPRLALAQVADLLARAAEVAP